MSKQAMDRAAEVDRWKSFRWVLGPHSWWELHQWVTSCERPSCGSCPGQWVWVTWDWAEEELPPARGGADA